MVTKIDLVLLAGAALTIFLVVRGAGQFFKDFKLPDFDFSTSIGNIGETFEGFGEGVGDFFSNLQKQFDEFFESTKSSLAGKDVEVPGGTVTIPEDTVIDPETGIVTSETPPLIETGLGKGDPANLFGELRPKVFDTLIDIGIDLSRATEILGGAKTIEDLQIILRQANTGIFNQLQGTLGALAAGKEIEGSLGSGVSPAETTLDPGQLPLPPGFEGGGVSFIGGSIFPTGTGLSAENIAALSLSDIIDLFKVTASQAANIRAIAADDFGDFDFGESTGRVFPGIEQLPILSESNVSETRFEGLSATQIANILTGGNIQNFA